MTDAEIAEYLQPFGLTRTLRCPQDYDNMRALLSASKSAAPSTTAQDERGAFDAMKYQVLLGYDDSGDAIFGTDPKALALAILDAALNLIDAAAPAQSGEPVAWVSRRQLDYLVVHPGRSVSAWGSPGADDTNVPLYTAPQSTASRVPK